MVTRLEKHEKVRELLRQDPARSDREIGRIAGISHPTVASVRAENPAWSRPARPARSAPSLTDAVAVVLRAAESGELDRDVLAGIVAARWDLKPGDRLQFDDGRLFREQGRPRRTVAHRAE